MSRQMQGYLFLTLAMMMVGSTVIASKLIAAGLPPFTATACRFAIALPVFLGLMRATGTSWPRLSRHDWIILVVQAGAGSVGYTTLLISGLGFTSAANAGIVIGTLPVVAAVIAILVLREQPQRFLILAIILATIGVLSIAFHGSGDGAAIGTMRPLIGDALIFAAVLCEGLFILLNKRLQGQISPLVQSTLMTGFGLVVATLPALGEIHGTAMTHEMTMALLGVAYYALVPTVGGFLLWYAGAARVSGVEASLFTAVAPISAVILAALLLHEQVTTRQVIGVLCVLVAVLSLGLPRRS